MQKTININETLVKNASQCIGIDDFNELVNIALLELIENHPPRVKRRQPPVSLAGKAEIIGDIIAPSTPFEDFECLK